MQPRTLIQCLTLRAANDPTGVAVIGSDGRRLTFQELLLQVENTASALAGLGISRDDRIAVVLSPGFDLVLTLLGVASYAAAAPLDYRLTGVPLETTLRHLKPAAIVSHAAARWVEGPAQALGIRLIDVNLAATNAPHKSPTDVQPAFILATSGTTSRPKFVPQSQRGVTQAAYDLASWFELGAQDVCLGCMPLFHGNGLYAGLLPSLAAGGTFVALDDHSPATVVAVLSRFQPTWLTSIPTLLDALLRQIPENATVRHTLRFVRSGSARLAPETQDAFEKRFGVPVLAGYGSAEAAHISNHPAPPAITKLGSVGKPCGNDVIVAGEDGEALPPRRLGQVLVRGVSVTEGYLDDDNASLFLNGWLQTGDIGHFDDDGYLFLEGRIKQMINRGGESISPLAVEEVLRRFPGVDQAVAFALPHSSLGEIVAAAVVMKSAQALSRSGIDSFLREQLPASHVPHRILECARLPTNSVGKVQTDMLAGLLREERECGSNEMTFHELIVAQAIRQTMGVQEISPADHIFDLGGDSLSAISLCDLLAARLDTAIALETLLEQGTVANIAKAVADASTERSHAGSERVDRDRIPRSAVHAQAHRFMCSADAKALARWLAGTILLGFIPQRFDRVLFDRYVTARETFGGTTIDLESDLVANRMRTLFADGLGDTQIRTILADRRNIQLENSWACWRASNRVRWELATEVEGLEHAAAGLAQGNGVVLWGMSFCGSLFPKIALARAGIEHAPLSATDHGASYPLTVVGWNVVAPAYCLAENRYISERIYVPDDDNKSYLADIGRTLRANRCVWISAERRCAGRAVEAPLFGRRARFPIGAPALACQYDAALIPVYTERVDRFHYRVTLMEPIAPDDHDTESFVATAVGHFAKHLEQRVEKDPAGWIWGDGWVSDLVATLRESQTARTRRT